MLTFAVSFILIVIALTVMTFLFLQLPAFGKNPTGKRLDKIRKSTQYNASAFQNLEHTTLMVEGTSYLQMTKEFFSKGIDRKPIRPLPFVPTDLHKLENNSLVWFGHSSYLLRIADKNILVDPVSVIVLHLSNLPE